MTNNNNNLVLLELMRDKVLFLLRSICVEQKFGIGMDNAFQGEM